MNKDKNIKNDVMQKKVLFLLLPFWTPLNPPLGITCLKSYLEKYGYSATAIDLNIAQELYDFRQMYFKILIEKIEKSKQGNINNIGNDIFFNHLFIRLENRCNEEIIRAINEITNKTFFCDLEVQTILDLDNIVKEYYVKLNDTIVKLINMYKPDVLGLSTYTGTLSSTLFVARLVKQINKDIKIIVGGGIFSGPFALGSPNMNMLLEQTTDTVDKFIVGEGEKLFLSYLQGELPNDQRVYSLKDINGYTLDIKSLSIPNFSDIDVSDYIQMSAYTSRGCPFKCNFCSETVNWICYRKKAAIQIADELDELYDKYKQQVFLMGDSLLNPVVDALSEELIRRKKSYYWDGYLRVDDKAAIVENAIKWRRGGLYRVRFGIESGSPHVLALMNKKITVNQIKNAVSSLAYAGIKTTTYWIIGYPGETEDDFQMTLDLIEELKDDIWEAECNPFVFYYNGQVSSDSWCERRKKLYSDETNKMIGYVNWYLEEEPSREVIYSRVNRFVEHCKKCGIPNTYSLQDIYEADSRWQTLHCNAAPHLVNLKTSNHLEQEKLVYNHKYYIENTKLELDDGDFNFDEI